MSNKITKRALVSSLLAVILCMSMLMGTTFAWFTDSVTSGKNLIVSGNLDVALEKGTLKDDNTTGGVIPDDFTWTEVTSETPVFKEGALYEPGYVETVALKVVNKGTLTLRYNFSTMIFNETPGKTESGEDIILSEYLTLVRAPLVYANYDRGLVAKMADGTIYAEGIGAATAAMGENLSTDVVLRPGEESLVCLAIVMPTTVGNEANYAENNKPEISLGLLLAATQQPYEDDSFGSDYDDDATYPVVSPLSFEEALKKGGQVVITNEVYGANATVPENVVADLNLTNKGINSDGVDTTITNNGTLTVTGGEGSSGLTSGGNVIVNNGSTTLGEVAITGGGTSAPIYNTGDLVIKDTVILHPVNSTSTTYTIVQESNDKATTVIENVTLVAERGAIAVSSGTVVVNDGSFTVDGVGNKVGHVIYATGANTKVEINGGDFVHNRNCTKGAMICADSGAVVVVNGGTFSKGPSGYKSKWLYTANGGSIILQGGSFRFDPRTSQSGDVKIADGYQVVFADGWYNVVPVTP